MLTDIIELRNSIYALCQAQGPETLVRKSTAIEQDSVSHQRLFLSLTHVNKQIRNEFLPLYMQDFHHNISISDIAAYTRAFPKLPKTVSGTIAIDVEKEHDKSGEVDVAPLLQLLSKHAYLEIRSSCSSSGTSTSTWSPIHLCSAPSGETPSIANRCDLVKSLFAKPDTAQQARWSRYAQSAVERMWVSSQEASPRGYYKYHVWVVIKRSSTEWWMGYSSSTEAYRRELRYWAAKSGYPATTRESCRESCLTVCAS
jgi:hypothetical protein